ncbi:hypothetical protein ID866_2208 [Astraeus odoratus]|nr:hypothetical protein ID866_2208 [Astraeus odoratus]
MSAGITHLPTELVEYILFHLDPLDVSKTAQTCWMLRNVVYGDDRQSFWRVLYLAQPLDDPRFTVTHLGRPRAPPPAYPGYSDVVEGTTASVVMTNAVGIDWASDLQHIIRAKTVIQNPALCREGEWKEVLSTLLMVATNLPAVPFCGSGPESRNVAWITALLGDGKALSTLERISESTWTHEEKQMLARLHVWIGLTPEDFGNRLKRASTRALVYDLSNYSQVNGYGPFLKDGTMRVDWMTIHALAHVYGILQLELDRTDRGYSNDSDAEDDVDPYSQSGISAEGRAPSASALLPFCQSVIAPNMDLEQGMVDWAGIEGHWTIGYCFLDDWGFAHYNGSEVCSSTTLFSQAGLNELKLFSPSFNQHALEFFISEDDVIDEEYHAVGVRFRITGFEPDPDHPSRPKINYAGDALDDELPVTGFVKLTPDDQIWWHFGGGNGELGNWNCEGIGLGSIRSPAGVVGVWSSFAHGDEDPVGPFWMYRQFGDEEEENAD